MASAEQSEMRGSYVCVLALTLLVMLIFGFVLMLSRVPVGIPGSELPDVGLNGSRYQFYSLLPEPIRSPLQTRLQARSQTRSQTPSQVQVAPDAVSASMVREASGFAAGSSPAATLPVAAGTTSTLATRAVSVGPTATDRGASANRSNSGYLFFQVGNYRYAEDAERNRASMLLNGFRVTIAPPDPRDINKGYRVRLGPYTDPEQAEIARHRLRQSGINYQLIRIHP